MFVATKELPSQYFRSATGDSLTLPTPQSALEMAIRKSIYPIYDKLSNDIDRLARTGSVQQPSLWQNPLAYFAGFSRIALTSQNSECQSGEIWLKRDTGLKLPLVVSVAGEFSDGNSVRATFNRMKTPLLETLSFNAEVADQAEIKPLSAEIEKVTGITAEQLNMYFDLNWLMLQIRHDRDVFWYGYNTRLDRFNGGLSSESNQANSIQLPKSFTPDSYISILIATIMATNVFKKD